MVILQRRMSFILFEKDFFYYSLKYGVSTMPILLTIDHHRACTFRSGENKSLMVVTRHFLFDGFESIRSSRREAEPCAC